MKKKKICFIAQFPPPMHGLSKAVETLYYSQLSNIYEFEKADIKNNKKILSNLIRIWKSKADLFYFTISQTKGGNIRDLLILKLLSLKKKKCLIHLHGGYYRKLVDNDLPRWQKKINYNAISNLDGAIVLSDSLKSIFQGMILNEKIFVVPNCVDDQFLMSDDEFNRKLKVVKDKNVLNVLYLSNFIKSKGYPEVLELAKKEKERCESGEKKRLHFNFAGKFFGEEEENFFFDYIKRHNLQDYVTYHGVVIGEQKKILLMQSDIFILLTNYSNEGQPISILEAMGNGMVIVTTNHAGIPDIVKDGINGLIVDKTQKTTTNIIESIAVLENNFESIMRTNRIECLSLYREIQYLNNIDKIFKQI